MTDAEALELKSGALLETKVAGVWRDVVFVGAYDDFFGETRFRVRRQGPDRRGRPLCKLRRTASELRPHPAGLYSHVTANVYADFLSERGEERAAQILREAFPLDDGKESPK